MPVSLGWPILATFAMVGLVWAMFHFQVEPFIVLALILCITMVIGMAFMIRESLGDTTRADVEELSVLVQCLQSKQAETEKRIRDLEGF